MLSGVIIIPYIEGTAPITANRECILYKDVTCLCRIARQAQGFIEIG